MKKEEIQKRRESIDRIWSGRNDSKRDEHRRTELKLDLILEILEEKAK